MCAHPDLCQKQKLDAEVELGECEVESVSACRKGSEGEPEFLVHWAGGVDKGQAAIGSSYSSCCLGKAE